MSEPILSAVTQAVPSPDTLPLDFIFPFFLPGCGCDVGHPSGPVPLGAVFLVVLAFAVVRMGCFSRRRRG